MIQQAFSKPCLVLDIKRHSPSIVFSIYSPTNNCFKSTFILRLVLRRPDFLLVDFKAVDQPVWMHSLNTAFTIVLKSLKVCQNLIFASCKILIFWLVSVVEQADLSLISSNTSKTSFLVTRSIICQS